MRSFLKISFFRCGIKFGIPGYSYLNIIYTGAFQVSNILLSIFTYTNMFLKIIRSSIRVRMLQKEKKMGQIMTTESKRVMIKFVTFVLALFAQYLPITIYLAYSASGHQIHDYLYLFTVIFTNLGGVFNLIIYVIFRRKKSRGKGGITGQTTTMNQTRSDSLKMDYTI